MKKFIILFSILLLLGGIGGLVASMSGKSAKAAGKVEEKPKELATLQLDEFLVNLADTNEPHYLKAVVVLEIIGGAKEVEEIKATSTARIRDAIITTMSRRHLRELLTVDGKQALKDSIRKEVNRVLEREAVNQVYFTSIAMQ